MLGWTVSLFASTPILTLISVVWVASALVSVPIFLVWPWTRPRSLFVMMMVSPLLVLLSSTGTTWRRRIWPRPLITRSAIRRHSNSSQISARCSFSWPVPFTQLNLYLPPIDAKAIELIFGLDGIILKLELGKTISSWHLDFLRIILRRSEGLIDDVAIVQLSILFEQFPKFILRKSLINIANVQARLYKIKVKLL